MPHDAQTYATTIDNTWDNPSETKAKGDAATAAARSKYDQAEKDTRTMYAVQAATAPYISAISPSTFSGAPSAPVTLIVTGGGFSSTAKVQVGITERTTEVNSPTQLTATFTAPATSGAMDVTVVDGVQRSNAVRMTFTIALVSREGAPTEASLKADIITWLLENGVELDEPALTNLTKTELLSLVEDTLSPPE